MDLKDGYTYRTKSGLLITLKEVRERFCQLTGKRFVAWVEGENAPRFYNSLGEQTNRMSAGDDIATTEEQIEAFRKAWRDQISGLKGQSSWITPIIGNTPTEIDQNHIQSEVLKSLHKDTSDGDIIAVEGVYWKYDRDKDEWRPHDGVLDLTPDCECGKDKHGFAAHMRFCPRYERY